MNGTFKWAVLATATFVVACGTILDIRDAETDPLLLGNQGGQGTGAQGGTDNRPLCTRYCDTVQANCVGDNQVYASDAVCFGICERLQDGKVGDETGNSIECRLTNALSAKTTGEPEAHCIYAGPGGAGICGSDCEAYCSVLQQVCGARFNMDYVGVAQCITQCAADLPDRPPYNSDIRAGNSIQCRLYHVSAATDQPSQHCAHAAGEPPCVDAGGMGGMGGGGTGGQGGAGSQGGAGG